MASATSLKAQMKKADRSGAAFAVLIGDNELASGNAEVRDLREGTQKSVRLDRVADTILSGKASSI